MFMYTCHAQVQGVLYLFRILQQILKYVGSYSSLVMGTEHVSAIISYLTPVAHFPNFYDSLGTVKEGFFSKGDT